MVRIRTIVVVAFVAGMLAPAPAHAAGEAAAFTRLVARERARAGVRALSVADDLVAVARRYVNRLASEGRLAHNPALGTDVRAWQLVGENVGRGTGIEVIHEHLMASPSHRANIVDPRFRELGIATATSEVDGKLYMVQVFRQPEVSGRTPGSSARPGVPTAGRTGRNGPAASAVRAQPAQAVALLVRLTQEDRD